MRATQLDHIAHEFERIEAACTRHKALVASKEKVGQPLPFGAVCKQIRAYLHTSTVIVCYIRDSSLVAVLMCTPCLLGLCVL